MLPRDPPLAACDKPAARLEALAQLLSCTGAVRRGGTGLVGTGSRVFNWIVGERLGAGAMGAVYLARDALLPDEVAALKVLAAVDDAERERFLREVQALRRLRHPAIVGVKGWGETDDGQLWLAMELVSGADLDTTIAQGATPWSEVLAWLEDLADGLAHAHALGVFHRDLKPANVVVREGHAVLVDFGVALDANRTRLTATGLIPGTPAYIAPEVFRGDEPDPRLSDLYALGQIAFEALTGHRAFGAPASLSEGQLLPWMMARKLQEGPLDPGPPVPEGVRELVRRLTEPDPAHRVATAHDALAAVRALRIRARPAEGLAVVADPHPPPGPPAAAKPRRIGWLAGAALLAVTTAACGVGTLAMVGLAGLGTEPTTAGLEPGAEADVVAAEEPTDLGTAPAPEAQTDPEGLHGDTPLAAAAPAASEPAQPPVRPPALHAATPRSPPTPILPMVLVPAGRFTMGCTPGQQEDCFSDRQPAHEVTITRSFHLGRTEVTQAQWQAVMGTTPSSFASCGAACPVEQVSWLDAIQFANRLSEREGRERCYAIAADSAELTPKGLACTGYRLPTEAEWEYAARGGRDTLYAGGNDLAAVGWTSAISNARPHPVGLRAPNGYGLLDMTGNVSEWVWDRKDPTHDDYADSAQVDPLGPEQGTSRRLRGGWWGTIPVGAQLLGRGGNLPTTRWNGLGVRLARTAGAP